MCQQLSEARKSINRECDRTKAVELSALCVSFGFLLALIDMNFRSLCCLTANPSVSPFVCHQIACQCFVVMNHRAALQLEGKQRQERSDII